MSCLLTRFLTRHVTVVMSCLFTYSKTMLCKISKLFRKINSRHATFKASSFCFYREKTKCLNVAKPLTVMENLSKQIIFNPQCTRGVETNGNSKCLLNCCHGNHTTYHSHVTSEHLPAGPSSPCHGDGHGVVAPPRGAAGVVTLVLGLQPG